MSVAAADAAYTLQALQDMLGISRSDVLGYIKAGFVTPSRGARNAYRFGFQDVVLLRTAQSLRDADISAAKIRKSLQRLRALLPAAMPLSGLRITALGDDIAVREDGQAIAADTGQFLFDFEVTVEAGSVLTFPGKTIDDSHPAVENGPDQAGDFLERGAQAIDRGAIDEALAIYEAGIAASATDPALHFNRAIVLEDLERADDAIVAYQRCLEFEPDYVDAHWNLARLYELRGVKTLALRHFSAFRRLSR